MSSQEFKYSLLRHDGFTLPGSEAQYAPDLAIEPIHTAIHLDVDLESQSASGFTEITLVGNVAGKRQIKLDAVDFEGVKVVTLDTATLSHRYDGETITLTWEDAFEKGEERRVAVHYSINQPITGLSFSKPNDDVPNAPLFAITDNETERARYWFPCVDFLTVRTRMDFYLTAAENLTILAGGKLVEEKVEKGRKTAHWHLDYPCPSYLACFAIGEFTRYDDEPLRDIPIAYFGDKFYTPEQLNRSFDKTRPMLEWMEQKLGLAYPYAKYYQFAALGIGGAMENISLVSWDDKVVLDETRARELKYIVDLINVHEMAHSYFGDAIVSYDFAHVWLKESWATYIESVWLEDTEGKQAMDWQLAQEAADYIGEAKNRYVRPIVTREYDHSWNMFDMHLYPGGAWRLHMLRHKVGSDSFWSGVQEYVQTYAGQTVETIDFQRCIEKHAGINLGRFFDQWFYSCGYPVLKVSFDFDEAEGLGKLNVEQTQVDSKRNIGVFEFELEVTWTDEKGTEFAEILEISREKQVFQFPMSAPQTFALDPDQRLLAEIEFNPGDDRLMRLLKSDQTVKARMQAITALAKTGKRKNLQSIADYLRQEKFWGLRVHAYRELAKVGNPISFDILADLLIAETDDMVLATAASALGKHRHPVLRAAILKKLKEADLPYFAQLELLSSLGNQRNLDDLTFLVEYSKKTNWRNFVKSGAFRGLGALRHASGVDTLIQNSEIDSLFPDERVERYHALGSLYKWVEEWNRGPILDVLINGTRDRHYFAAKAAARSLAATGASEGIPVLESLRSRWPRQDWPIIQRFINTARDSGKPTEPEQKFKQKLEEIESKLGKFESRIQDLEEKAKH